MCVCAPLDAMNMCKMRHHTNLPTMFTFQHTRKKTNNNTIIITIRIHTHIHRSHTSHNSYEHIVSILSFTTNNLCEPCSENKLSHPHTHTRKIIANLLENKNKARRTNESKQLTPTTKTHRNIKYGYFMCVGWYWFGKR